VSASASKANESQRPILGVSRPTRAAMIRRFKAAHLTSVI